MLRANRQWKLRGIWMYAEGNEWKRSQDPHCSIPFSVSPCISVSPCNSLLRGREALLASIVLEQALGKDGPLREWIVFRALL